ncbi:MAG: hypothetical protein RMK17_01710 [bacterium]|nr:hypothetical protein [Patescibacteria group bacterium]MDW8279862.1 hypothetical protein [bacterium]
MTNWFKHHKFLNIFFGSALILLIIGFVLVFLKFNSYPSQFIVKYSNYAGIIAVSDFKYLILIFLSSIVIFLINFILAKKFEERDLFFGKFIAVINFLICLLIFIYFMAIIKIN